MTTILQITSPLNWPAHMPPTDRIYRQVNPQFQLNMPEREAVVFLEDEIARTPQVTSATLSADAQGINSTLPVHYLTKNTGAAVRLTIEDTRYHLCCDRWQSLAHNIYALHLGLRYFRQLSEWGVGTLPLLMAGMREVVSTNHATSSTTIGAEVASHLTEWQRILGLGATATLEDANALYRLRAKAIGESDPEQLCALNIAIQEARQALGG